MSTEKIQLQPLGKYADEDEEKSERQTLPEKLNDLRSREAGEPKTRKNICKGIFITMMTLLGYVFLNGAISMISPFYPIVALGFSVSFYMVGLVIGMAALCVALLSPFFGYFLPHLGLKFTQLAGLFLAGGSLILFGFVPQMPNKALFIVFSLLLRMVEGIGTAMYSTASYTLLTQLYPEKKGTIVGLIELSISAGYAVGAPVGGGLQEAGGFKLPFILIGTSTVIFMIILMVIVQPTECTSQKLPWRLVLNLFSNLMFVTLVLSLTISISALAAVTSNYGRFLHRHFHLSVGVIGAVYLASTVMYVLGSIFSGPLTDRLIPRCLIVLGLVVAGVGCALIGPPDFISQPQLWISIVASGIMALGIPFASVPVYSDIFEIAKNMRVVADEEVMASTLSGIIVASFSAGEFIGPVLGGSLVGQTSFRAMVAIFGLILIGTALVVIGVTALHKLYVCKFKKDRSEVPVTSSL